MFQLILVFILMLFAACPSQAKTLGTAYVSSSQLEAGTAVEPRDESRWYSLYSHGLKLLGERKYQTAESVLMASMKEAKNNHGNSLELAKSRAALGCVACADGTYREAESLFANALQVAKHNDDQKLLAETLYGLAVVALNLNEFNKAREYAEEALQLKLKLFGQDHHDTGQCQLVLGRALTKVNLDSEGEEKIQQGLAVLRQNPGPKELDYADALRDAALYYQSTGDVQRGVSLFEESYRIKDGAVHLGQPASVSSSLSYKWENGSPRSLEFPDYDVPLRYIIAGDARVSAAVVDLWELMGVLISITNVSDHQIDVGVTTAYLYETKPHHTKLEMVDPMRIDHIRRERQIWDITYKMPWLANIQKTRTVRGFVPTQGHDLFRGPNIFGIYGEWAGAPRILPEKMTVDISPEQVWRQAQTPIDPSIIHSAEINYQGLTTFQLEPFESRTGVLFFMNPRSDEVLLKVPVGNVQFQFPFHCRKRRIAEIDELPIFALLDHQS
jgi:tetratricopeptide (TPR) repeat protein